MRRVGEHGGIAPLMAGLMMVLLTILVGASAVGRLAMVRADAQRASDAACLVAANVVRQEGLPLTGAKKQKIGEVALRNFGGGMRLDVVTKDETGYVEVACRAEVDIEVPWGTEVVSATTKSRAAHVKYDKTLEIKPRLILVLDYSGSMVAPMVGDPNGRTSVAVLRDSVKTLLSLNLPVEWGAVFFDTKITKIAMGPDAVAKIRSGVARRETGTTNTEGALDAANDILSASPKVDPDQASYVLLVSDGEPTCCGGNPTADAQAAAARVRNGSNLAYVFTLHIENNTNATAAAALRGFMQGIGGDNTTNPDPDAYQSATTDAALKDRFEKMAALIACPVTLTELPPDGVKMFTFVRSPSGDETPMKELRELKPDAIRPDLNSPKYNYRNMNVYWLEAAKKRIYVSKSVCDRILKAQHIIVTRYLRPALSE